MKMISLVDISARIQIEKWMKTLWDKIKDSTTDKKTSKMMLLAHKDVKTGRNIDNLALQQLQS